VDLFAAARGTEETLQTNGRRHMLEHIQALGVKGDLDTRLESSGGFLTAHTTRDSIEFEMTLKGSDLPLALGAVRELVTGAPIDAAAIKREANLIAEENALRAGASLASAAAWERAYGAAGVDTMGKPEVLNNTSPSDLEKLRTQTFAANNLTVVVSGDIDIDVATKAVKDALGLLPGVKTAKETSGSYPEPMMGSIRMDADGEYRAAPVPGFRSPATAAALAAALALATELDHAQVIYTPSARPGMVLVGVSQGRIGSQLDRSDAASLFEFGRRLAIRWVESKLTDPANAAEFRGMLMCRAIDVRPETMLENLAALRFDEFQKAFDLLRRDGIVVEGQR